MSTKYTHLELDQDVVIGIGGYYTPQQEVRLQHNGKEVLYVVGRAVVESSCCATGSWVYSVVPGYIVDWQHSQNEDGRPVTEVEPIVDKKVQEAVRQLIQKKESASLIGFW